VFFLSPFANLRKVTVSFMMSVCLSVRPHWTTRLQVDRISIKFDIWGFFENLTSQFRFDETPARPMGTLRDDLCSFMIIPPWVLLRTRNGSAKMFRDNQNAYFMFNNFFSKIVLFMRLGGKIWQSQTVHRWQYNTARAHCMLAKEDYEHTLRICNKFFAFPQ